MLFSTINYLIKRYTPPTCILEIYQRGSLIPLINSNPDSDQINFQLHFDDPRLPQEEKITLTGDRNLLARLREQVNSYISQYLQETVIEENNIDSQIQPSINQTETQNISLTDRGLCHHQLLYSLGEKRTVNLSNTQLFDLANVLENYHLESAFISEQHNKSQGKKLSLIATILGLVSFIGGFWWWRNQQIIANQNQTDDSLELNSEEISSNIEEAIPPSPLDPTTIPPMILPTETEDLKNRATLPPPPATLTQPPIPENLPLMQDNLPEIPLPQPSPTTNQNTIVAPDQNNILPPPQAPLLPPAPPPPAIPNPNENVIAINTTPQPIPQPSIPQSQPIQSTNSTTTNYQPRLSRLPVLQSGNSQSFTNPNLDIDVNDSEKKINQVAINQAPNLTPKSPENEPSTPNQSLTTNSVTQEVKQYFQAKWQPPENLTRSIEYRLLVNENGSLSRIIPLGQVAQVFLDRTGMPLLGEPIASSPSESATIRLILSPNGNVQTFQE